MEDKNRLRLRIKYPSGAEFEAEGSEVFIMEQKKAFEEILYKDRKNEQQIKKYPPDIEKENIWQKVVSYKDSNIPYIPLKIQGMKANSAALIIIAALKIMKNIEEISAIKLSKALKLSGFSPKRLDRELSYELKTGMLSALGTKRNRVYKINPKGIEEAYLKTLMAIKEVKN